MGATPPKPELGLCPECNLWSPVAFDGSIPPGGYWWIDSVGCPECGAVVCVESECEFRPAARQRERLDG